ncbi:glycosyltransferase family 2 protein [Chryseobacterium polytrichastri]|uniref:Glycosyl transferase family 2 n=1 Tax=Chryseobacterium polytrichastri TaxID=1302687 RepID=A0A1M7BBU2_9FLAO|nr:glycosyltransferase family 2 protein [Chryseobacterium polytrichastri]SHL52450.1 Glycosyl transferase family 2 [Chryseobacterium polytrichastri]
MNTISVSVIIPIYNAEKFLDETLESVIRQSLVDFELILINDGSTDNSAFICDNYLKKDKRVQYFMQENSGVSVARNLGLSYARGEYVFFLDSDDILDSEFLETSYNAAKKQNSDITIVGEEFCRRLPNVPALPTCAQFLKMDFLNKYPDIRFPKNIQPCEDGLFSHQLIALTQNIGTNPDGIYHYRHHENQNHLKINEDCWKVVHQIPIWFDILNQFYTNNNLFHSHALHLALFIEHEPFELRYLSMSLDNEQKTFLFNLIKTFMVKILPYLSDKEETLLSTPFLYFINSNNVNDFDQFYRKYIKRKKIKKRIYLFLIKFIPLRKLRKQVRRTICEKF